MLRNRWIVTSTAGSNALHKAGTSVKAFSLFEDVLDSFIYSFICITFHKFHKLFQCIFKRLLNKVVD